MFKDIVFKNKTIVITGGSRGIGAYLVESFAKSQAQVFFFYLNSETKAITLQNSLREQGCHVTAMQVDVCDKSASHKALKLIFDQTQSIDVVINNSGILQHQLLVRLEVDDFQKMVNTNILGVMNVTDNAIPYFKKQKYGKIINMSSVAGAYPSSHQSSYGLSKGAIDEYTRALAAELAPYNILVNAVAPGVIATDMTKEMREYGEELILSKLLIKRFGEPEDVGNLINFLASPYAAYITGQIIYVDGGFKLT